MELAHIGELEKMFSQGDQTAYIRLVQAYADAGKFVVEMFSDFLRLHNVWYDESKITIDISYMMRNKEETIEELSHEAWVDGWLIPSSPLIYACMKVVINNMKEFQRKDRNLTSRLSQILLCNGLGWHPLYGKPTIPTSTFLEKSNEHIKVTHFKGCTEYETSKTIHITKKKNDVLAKELLGADDQEYWKYYSAHDGGFSLRSGYVSFQSYQDVQEEDSWTVIETTYNAIYLPKIKFVDLPLR